MMMSMRKKVMGKKLLATMVVLLTVGLGPLTALADEVKSFDGRLDDYGKPVTLDGGTALTYFVWVGVGVIGLLGMFKNAHRSHLD